MTRVVATDNGDEVGVSRLVAGGAEGVGIGMVIIGDEIRSTNLRLVVSPESLPLWQC